MCERGREKGRGKGGEGQRERENVMNLLELSQEKNMDKAMHVKNMYLCLFYMGKGDQLWAN